ncbi:condensation domain-containing protein [Micromonospora coxensis]|uniref:Condensation domain-containing protein n=1 Tax=Micromonospora coxensis TaxID=356852 RepID=A0A1C5K2K8_9ACTN|nr:condensation domain-containing protein [Micromonospora coxensis]SCG77022.1 Condensation domain-containing protein [Micromonospora coxensis]
MPVVFHGTGPGKGELAWGQRAIWQAMHWLGDGNHYFNLVRMVAVPDGRSMSEVCTGLRQVVERHEGLRTRFPGYPDEPRQELHPEGTLDLVVHDVTASADVGSAAEELAFQLRGQLFRHEQEWPLRVGVVCRQDVPLHLVLVVSHLCVDGAALRQLCAEIAAALAADEPAGPTQAEPDGAGGPLALARAESDPRGQAKSAAAMRHWRAALTATSHSIFDFPTVTPDEPRYAGLTLESSALAVAAEHIARRLRVTSSSVLLTAVAAVLGHYTDHDHVTLQIIAANRRPELRTTVAPLAQNGMFTTSVAGSPFDEAVRKVLRSSLSCFRHAAYDPRDLAALLEQVRVQRGAHPDREAFFNDARPDGRWDALPQVDPTPENLRRLRDDTRLAVTDRWERLGIKAFWAVHPMPDRAVLHLQADTAYVPVEAALMLMRGVEEIVVRAVHEPVVLADLETLIGVRPVRRGESWLRTAAGWAHVPSVAEVVAASPRLAASAVFADGGEFGPMVAYAVPTEPGLTVEQLHAELCAAVGERTDAVTPGHYVLCASAPPPGSPLAVWQRQPVSASGSGRPPR